MPTKVKAVKGSKVSKKTNNVGKSNSVAEGAVTEPEHVLPQGASDMEVTEDVDTRAVVKTKVESVNSWYAIIAINIRLNVPRKFPVLPPRRCR